MKVISQKVKEPQSMWPKRVFCDECGAELEYDKGDVHIGWMGCEYVTCPACDRETVVGDQRVQPPTWKATFRHESSETGAVDIKDAEIQVYVKKAIKHLCSDEWKPGESYIIATGNLLILGIKWENGVDVYVTKDYWQDRVFLEEYGMVK